MLSKSLRVMTAFASLLVIALPVYSNGVEQGIVDKVIEAYGGKKFETLRSLTLTSDLRYGGMGQGYTSDFVDLDPMFKIHEFDFIQGYGSEEAWGADGGYAERVFTTNEGQFTIDYNNKTYAHNKDANLYTHFGGEIRGSDTLLAYDLMKHRKTATHKGQMLFRGTAHDLLEFDMPGTSIDPVLWVNSDTGYISKMRRDIPEYFPINYVFNDFKKTKGIAYGEVFELYIGPTLLEYTKSRTLIPNRIRKNTFALDRGIETQPETFSAGEMSIDSVAPSLHHVGQNNAYSAFFDAGDHIIGVGGYGGLADRFAAYQDAQGHSKPLKQLILTHHHRDHLEGASEALTLGAQLIGPETARKNLLDVTELEALSADQFMALSDIKTSLDHVDIHRISTSHVQEFALAYFPTAKTAFDADHYNARFKNRASYVSPNAMSLKSEIDRLGLDMDYLIGAHSRKRETWEDFLDMAAQYRAGKCPTQRKICAHLD